MSQSDDALIASIRQRLLNRSRQDRVDFQLLLTRYTIERLLYRLGRSDYRDYFILKGAMLSIAWEGWSPPPLPAKAVTVSRWRPARFWLRA